MPNGTSMRLVATYRGIETDTLVAVFFAAPSLFCLLVGMEINIEVVDGMLVRKPTKTLSNKPCHTRQTYPETARKNERMRSLSSGLTR